VALYRLRSVQIQEREEDSKEVG